VYCGIDWAEDHHDVAIVDMHGTLIAKRRISDDAAGFVCLLELFAEAGDSAEEPIPVAIETGRGARCNASHKCPARDDTISNGPAAATVSRPRANSPCPAASRCRAAVFSAASSASSCADPT
jgi:hypothetical protein